ncbi:hypothetical protein [Nodularia spumigena]|uniref:hypothetical protein n=1 Tax=Nodularia spumigena TaxID=70799 RepID=UPI00137AC5FF|nr:hypothetical protein [Nodularia spumigena]
MSEEKDKETNEEAKPEETKEETKTEETKYCPSPVTIPGKTVKERADKFRERFKR